MDLPFPTCHPGVIAVSEDAMPTAITSIAVGLLALSAYSDACTRRIPNPISLAVACLGLFRIALAGDGVAAAYTLAAGAVIFAAALALYRRGAVGGGDVKLVAAMALLVGYREVFGFLLLMSIFGGVLALIALARETLRGLLVRPPACLKCPTGTAAGETAGLKPTIPYGIAIAAAGAMTLLFAR